MANTGIFLQELEIEDTWPEGGASLGVKGKPWIATVELTIASTKEKKLFQRGGLEAWGDLIWFFVCSSSLTEKEILSNERFNIEPNKYLVQDELDMKKVKEYAEQKVKETAAMQEQVAVKYLQKHFFFD